MKVVPWGTYLDDVLYNSTWEPPLFSKEEIKNISKIIGVIQ